MARAEADLVGDDLHSRSACISGVVAKALATGEEPARAYRLFQIGEELNRNAETDVRSLGDRLLRMHEPTYLTVLSRARDRRTLDFSAMAAPAVTAAAGFETSVSISWPSTRSGPGPRGRPPSPD